jgi:hypothetical protein
MSIACAIAGISRLRHHGCFVAKLHKKSGKTSDDFPAFKYNPTHQSHKRYLHHFCREFGVPRKD